jgi:hypothetical protein
LHLLALGGQYGFYVNIVSLELAIIFKPTKVVSYQMKAVAAITTD